MRNSILEQARILARQREEVGFEKAQEILMDYLKDNLQDTEAWLLLTRIECNSPFDDPERIIHYANHVLAYDPSNVYALLFWSYADYYLMGSSDDRLYDQLCMAHSTDPEIMSMIELAKARYFEQRNIKKCEDALKTSIEYCQNHVRNFCMLGEVCLEQGKIVEARCWIEQGLKNIKQVVTSESSYKHDPVSITKFLEEFFAGTSIGIVEHGQLRLLLGKENKDIVA